jgi:hypothetical protein
LIVRSFGARDDFAENGDDKLAAQIFRLRVRVRCGFLADDDLRYALAVAQINERKNPEITFFSDPAHQHNLLADIRFAQLAARMSFFQIS